MSNELKYLSPEWAEEALKRLQSEITVEKMKNITTSMLNIYKNCPDGKERYVFYNCVDGKFTEVLVGETDLPDAEFRIIGDYEILSKITKGDIKSQRALMGGKLKLKGNMVKALKLASLADRMNKILSQIPAVY